MFIEFKKNDGTKISFVNQEIEMITEIDKKYAFNCAPSEMKENIIVFTRSLHNYNFYHFKEEYNHAKKRLKGFIELTTPCCKCLINVKSVSAVEDITDSKDYNKKKGCHTQLKFSRMQSYLKLDFKEKYSDVIKMMKNKLRCTCK
jgi:hypothetical protein